nr:metallophosphoesterase family protein [Bacteroides sp. 519]
MLFVVAFNASAQTPKTLKFTKEGKFKIVQFTDVHFKYKNPASDIALERINEVLEAEKPNLVIFTGDVIYAPPADTAMRVVLQQVANHKIPYVVTFGNHDDEHNMSRRQLYDVIRTVPYNLMPEYIDTFDFVLPLQASDSKQDAALLYCLDSNSYAQPKEIGGYGWFSFNQVNWYLNQSKQYTEKNNNTPLPALAFFHIPVPEYNEAMTQDNVIMVGKKMERECSPKINTGIFAAMRLSGDVMGIFVGHDHDNDYAVMWKDVLLAYGRYSGGNTVYNNIPNGARVIEMYEGTRTFKSWIRQANNEIVYPVTYPDSFRKKKD